MLIVFFLQKKLLVGHFSDLKQVHCNGCFTLARTPHVELNLTPFFGETWKWELEINLGPMDWELLEGCSSYFPSPTWKQGAIYIQHFGLPPNTRLFPPMLFLEVSVIISDDLYEMLVLFGSLPLTKKIYTSQSIFPWQKPIRFVWGGHFLIKNLESRHHLLIPFLRSRRFRRCVCSKAVHQKVLRANRPTKKTRSCLFSGWKEGTIPHGSKYRMTEQFWWPKKNSACHICLSVQGLGLGRRTVSSVAKVLVENWVEMT